MSYTSDHKLIGYCPHCGAMIQAQDKIATSDIIYRCHGCRTNISIDEIEHPDPDYDTDN